MGSNYKTHRIVKYYPYVILREMKLEIVAKLLNKFNLVSIFGPNGNVLEKFPKHLVGGMRRAVAPGAKETFIST